jgi:hypothetical protein
MKLVLVWNIVWRWFVHLAQDKGVSKSLATNAKNDKIQTT